MTITTRAAYGTELPYDVLDANWTEINSRLGFTEAGFSALNTSYGTLNTTITGLSSTVGLLPQFQRDGDSHISGLTDGTETFELVPNAIELLKSSAIATSCASTAIDEVLASFSIPANTLGVNSGLMITPLWGFASSANNKILKVKVGGVLVYNQTRTTSKREAPLIELVNRGLINSQILPYDNAYTTANTTDAVTTTIDFASPVTVEILGQRANSGDALRLDFYRILHYIGE